MERGAPSRRGSRAGQLAATAVALVMLAAPAASGAGFYKAKFSGTVIAPGGELVANAPVFASYVGASGSVCTTKSGEGGGYACEWETSGTRQAIVCAGGPPGETAPGTSGRDFIATCSGGVEATSEEEAKAKAFEFCEVCGAAIAPITLLAGDIWEGTLTDPLTGPAVNEEITFGGWDPVAKRFGFEERAKTDSKGHFRIVRLYGSKLNWRLYPNPGRGFQPEFGEVAIEPIGSVTGGKIITNNFERVVPNRLGGHVTNAEGHALSGIEVELLTSTGEPLSLGGPPPIFFTGASGLYDFEKLPSGTYTLRFTDSEGRYASQYYNGRASAICADRVTVGPSGTSVDANTVMAAGAPAPCGGGSGGGGTGGGGTGGSGGGGGAGGAGGGGGGGGAKPVTTEEILAYLAKVLTPSGAAAKLHALLHAGGFAFTFAAPESGELKVAWYLVPRGAHVVNVAHAAKPLLVASGHVSAGAAGNVRLRVALTAQGRSLLKSAKRSVRLTAVASFAPAGAPAAGRSAAFTLPR